MTMRKTAWACVLLASVLGACGTSNDDGTDVHGDGRDDGGGECTAGEARCVGNVWETCTGGHWGAGTNCEESTRVCVESLGGCMPCFPDRTRCAGNDVEQCGDDGTTWTVINTCDPAAGESCDPASGMCIDPCATAASVRSNIGCEYWAVDLDNAESTMDSAASGEFAVVVANLSNLYSSEVVVERDMGFYGEAHDLEEVDRAMVDPGQLEIFRLPRWDVDGESPPRTDDDPQTGLSRRVFHITSSTPVVAYQFNTLNQVYSNAASVLIPTSALDTDYWAIITSPSNATTLFPGLPPNRDYLTIVGVEDGTTVWVTPTSDTIEGVGQASTGIGPVPAIAAGVRTEFTLDRFDVLNLETGTVARMSDPYPDLTASHIESTRPVVAFVGVDLAVMGNDVLPGDPTPEDPDNCCAEHMESQLTPTSALGSRFVVSRSVVRASDPDNIYWGMEYDYYRVLAVRDGTTVTTTLGDIGSFTLNAGEYREFKSRDGFILTTGGATTPVIVAQFIVSQEQVYEPRATAGGDSDMVYIPPVEQRRGTYIFTTGEGFSENWAVVSMPEGASATIDGADVAGTCHPSYPDGTLDGVMYRAYHCQIADGRHDVTATGEQPVGVMVFGYYAVGSYQYPAGSEYNVIFFG
jgi:hypothetical protein